ncbi:MAG: hypothetical protein A4S12_03255 [Proteobacteria bacterium SG_bin5]|nr:ferritin-like domain-containing protein [Sphingomonas sp.]OQW44662.1 MAG: hypothetical protein A4S12_03255 [Proteobacteria bacterium SG_bin5]
MTKDLLLAALPKIESRRADRRAFLRGAGVAAIGGGLVLSGCGDDRRDDLSVTPTPTPPPGTGTAPPGNPGPALSDPDVLNFALNLEYLEAQFYIFAATGAGLAASAVTGTGTQGAVTGGRRVNFTDPLVAAYAREIAADEVAHVLFLRQALGSAAVAQPAIDIGSTPTSAFSLAAQAAGLVSAGQAFDPYASDNNFLLAAYLFEDVGVTAYKGAAPLITNKTFLEASAGILAAEAYHAGLVRTALFRRSVATPSLIAATESISNARDSLDGTADLDQGIAVSNDTANLVPTDANGVAYSRSAAQVLNVVYLNRASVARGGFFPNGVNGPVNTSANNA